MDINVIKTGTVIDELMDGIEPGIVTTFFGFPGSGKTTLAMEISIPFLEKGKIAFIDTESGFSPLRLKMLTNKPLDNFLVFEPRSWEEQKNLNEKMIELKPKLIIVDSIISLFRIDSSETRELASYLRELNHIAKDLNIPIIATNQAYEWDGKTEMVSRMITEYWSKAVIYIEKTDRSGVRRLILKKHRWLPEGRELNVEITREGFRKSKRFGII